MNPFFCLCFVVCFQSGGRGTTSPGGRPWTSGMWMGTAGAGTMWMGAAWAGCKDVVVPGGMQVNRPWLMEIVSKNFLGNGLMK